MHKAGLQKGHKELLPWLHSISNHLWWSAKTCNGDPDLLIAKWTSIVDHYINVHKWGDDHFSLCAHEPIDNTHCRKTVTLAKLKYSIPCCKNCPKQQHFGYVEMCVCMQLAILNHNHNIEQQQTTTLDGQPRYKLLFPKGRKQWVAKPITQACYVRFMDIKQNGVVFVVLQIFGLFSV